jgi:prepilin-type N-terminal cleavage/methylation domain-containing protein
LSREETRVRKWTRRLAAGDEQGFSLTEVVAAMAVMSVVMVVVTTSLVRMFADVKRTEQTSFAADQLDVSLGRLDRELRYATHVSAPARGLDGTRWYMEFAIPARQKLPTDTADPQPRCRQLQLDTTNNSLRLAMWDLPNLTAGTPVTLATGVFLDNGVWPFTVYQPPSSNTMTLPAGVISATGHKYSMVQLRFTVTNGEVDQPVDMVFTSQNITADNIDSKTTETRCSKAARP